MKKILFGIFAHPDDEAFGPSGYLISRGLAGDEVHIICATDGAASGQGSAEIRYKELRKASEIIGAKTTTQLEFEDGSLNNGNFKLLVQKLCSTIKSKLPSGEKCEVSFVTFERSGITGHIDHIAVSFAVTYIFTHQSSCLSDSLALGNLRYFCLCDAQKAEDLDYFIYSPKGFPEEVIDETFDASAVLEQKTMAIKAHSSQDDYRAILDMGTHLLQNEHFMLYKH
jgi:LmbE family N-acetylglucosaminyl deacetylase